MNTAELQHIVIITPTHRMGIGNDIDERAASGYLVHGLKLDSPESVRMLLSGTRLPDMPEGSVQFREQVLAPEGLPLQEFSIGSPAIDTIEQARSVVAAAFANPQSVLKANGFPDSTPIYLLGTGDGPVQIFFT